MSELERKHLKLLLIEDDEDDCILIRGLLAEVASTNYEVTWVSTYENALAALAGQKYDICLMDYRLGTRSGLEILHQLAGCPDKPPIIVLTGHGDYEIDMEAMKHGAADYLVKDQIDNHVLERSIRYSIERKKSQDAIKESENQLKYLSDQLLMVQENERRKFAADLHDNLGQVLTAIKFNIENILTRMAPAAASADDLRSLIPMIQGAVEHVRNMYTQMRPSLLDDLGVLATISWFCREFENAHNRIRVKKEFGAAEEDIPGSLKLVIFRIVQETMSNIAAHSSADRAWLSLSKTNGNIGLEIRDNGSGFNVAEIISKPHAETRLGLIIMKRRAELSGGTMQIESEKGTGTTVRVLWPIQQDFPLEAGPG